VKDQGDALHYLLAAHVDSASPVSLHEQLTDALRAGLQSGVLKPGTAIPAERKRPDPATPIIITAKPDDVRALADAGADIIAFDATLRPGRMAATEALANTAHEAGCLAMADLASMEDALAAMDAGVDILGTTLSDYVGGPVPEEPDISLVARCAALALPVFAEGPYRTPDDVRAARSAGAAAVVVGSAITRPELVTGWFVAGMGGPLYLEWIAPP